MRIRSLDRGHGILAHWVYGAVLLIAITLNGPAHSATRYVDPAGSDTTNDCTSAGTPCKTIVWAMWQAAGGNPGDTISAAPGTYSVGLGERFPIVMTSGVQLISVGGAAVTTIDATGANRAVITSNAGNSSTLIRGFTIKGGLNTASLGSISKGGALILDNGDQTKVTQNVFVSNEARGYEGSYGTALIDGGNAFGGAIYASGTPSITDNVFCANIARGGNGKIAGFPGMGIGGSGGNGEGGAIYALSGGTVATISQNTFYGNRAIGGTGGYSYDFLSGYGGDGTAGAVASNDFDVSNNIFVENWTLGGTTSALRFYGRGLYDALSYNTSGGNVLTNNLFTLTIGRTTANTLGANFINADPLFHAVPADLHIMKASPASGAGASAYRTSVDLDGIPRAIPPSIGAYEASFVPTTTTLFSGTNPSTPGQSVTLTATVTSISGAPAGSVTFNDGATAMCTAVPLTMGQAQCTTALLSAASHSLAAQYSGSTLYATSTSNIVTQVVTATSEPQTRSIAISTRMQVLTGDDVMIGGFVISGSTPKTVAIRARGPSLASQGVSNALGNPVLAVISAADGSVTTNDDWGTDAQAAQLTISGFAPSMDAEAALLATLNPGAYTAIVSGAGGTIGVGIFEVYEVNHPESPLTAISTRGRVLTADNVLIGGFIISGTTPQTVVVRARGPSLAAQGVVAPLQDPVLQLVSAANGWVLSNDNWQTTGNSAQLQAIGYAPTDPRESALLVTLDPGAYTAIVSGAGGTTGVGIVEIYTP